MTIDYIPGTTSNLVGDPAEGGAFSSGNKHEISGANTSAANAATSATAAAASALSASNSASSVAASETNAATSATNAATSATAAATSATGAATNYSATLALYDQFDDRYLGSKTSDPTLDNDNNALIVGALYFNSTSNIMKVYNGSSWQTAAVDGTTILLKAQNLADLPSASTARTNLGLGTMAVEAAADYATLSGATFTGDVTAPEFIGVLQGETVFKAKAGEALTKGDAVYVSGISGSIPVVSKADANGASTYPAFGLAAADTALNANLDVVTAGQLKNIDTSGFALGDTLYLSNTPGQLTATPPSGEGSVIQNMGKVEREHSTAGSILVVNSGRTATTPNLNQNNIFVGDSNNRAVTQNIGTAVSGSTLTTIDINGGTIDSTVIGGSNPSSGEFSSLTASGATFTTATINGGSIGSSHLTFADNNKAIFGNDGNELSIYHDGSASIIEDQGTGNLLIKGTQLKLQSSSGETYAAFTNNGDAKLYHNNLEKLSTTSTGLSVTGDVSIGDADKVLLGDSSSDRLEVYYENNKAYLKNTGTGALRLLSSNWSVRNQSDNQNQISTADGGAVSLYYNGNVKLATTDTGATITGGLTTSGAITGEDLLLTDNNPTITLTDTDGTNQKVDLTQVGGSFVTTVRNNTSHGSIDFKSNNGTNNLLRLRIATSGDTNFYETDGSTVGARWDASAGSFGFGGQITPQKEVDVTGDVRVTGGVYFGTTAADNYLDDYEEGTWTPVMRDATTGGNVASAANLSGLYTKIGRHVNLTIRVINVSKTGMTATNDIYITGLPFAASDLSPSYRHIGSVESTRIDYGNSIQSRVTENTSYMMLSSSTNVGGLGTLNWSAVSADESGEGVADLFITHTYIAD